MRSLTNGTVLVVVADAELTRLVHRVAALASVPVTTVPGRAEQVSAAAWAAAAAVVVDPAAAGVLIMPSDARRAAVVVTLLEPDERAWRAAVGVGAAAVLQLPAQEAALLDWLVRAASPPPTARVLRCAGARGGVGTSTIAAALALAAAETRRTMLVDGDAAGGGLDLLLGVEASPGARWAEFATATGALRADAFTTGLPTAAGATVLSFAPGARPVPPAAMEAAVDAARRAFELVVLDASRAEPARLGPDAVTLVVVPAEVRAATAAAALVRRLSADGSDVRLVVRTPAPGDLRPRHVAEAVGLPVLAEWRWQRRVAAHVDTGRFLEAWRRSPLRTTALRTLRALDAA